MNNVRRVIHLADIHVRLFKRHKEYREVFETLYRDLAATDLTETVIVIAGDIVHSKTELSPEMVDLVSDFLKKLSLLAPVKVIAGNHDMNMANKDRLDALSPIIDNLRNANIDYYRESGVYPCGNVAFYVCSILGDQSSWPTPLYDGRTRVALFHGPIHNAKTDVGYTVTNRHVMIETFDGFDMVLLGDIHRHQVLQEHDAKAKKPIIVYPGSLIQQNHGETLKGHGWCDWDVASKTYTFHELKNPVGYYTLRVTDGVVPNYDDMPDTVRLRIFAGNMGQADIKKLVTTIRSKRRITELSVTNFEGTKKIGTDSDLGTILDINNEQFQNKLITDFLHEKMPELSDDDINKVLDLNKTVNAEINTDDLARKIMWRPLSLKFDNLFTYGEGNFIDFTSLNGVTGIFAPNASGKTSVAEAICFALYDRTPRTSRAANIMNTRKTSCYLEFIFEVDGTEYIIERKGKKNVKGEVKIDVDFWKVENGARVSLNGEERRVTDKIIAQVVGEYEDFILTTFSSSSQAGLFVDRGQADRKDLLSQFMGLHIFDKLHEIAQNESKDIDSKLKAFKKDDFTQELNDIQEFIVREELVLDTAKGMVGETTKRVEECNGRINDLHAQRVPVTIKETLERLESDKVAALVSHKKIQDEWETLKKSKADVIEKLEKAKSNLFLLRPHGNLEKWRVDSARKAEIDTRVLLLNKQLSEASKRYAQLETHQYDPNCEFCLKNGESTIQARATTQFEIEQLEKEVARLNFEGNNLSSDLQHKGNLVDDHKKYDDAKAWIAHTEVEIARMDYQLETYSEKGKTAYANFETAMAKINEYKENLSLILKNQELEKQIGFEEHSKRLLNQTLNAQNVAVQGHVGRLAVLNSKKRDMLTKIDTAKALEVKYGTYRAYLAAVCRDGLPYKLITDILPNLEAAVNNLLSQMVEFTVGFATDGKNVNMTIAYDQDRIWPLELASGMEKFITGLAIRVALTSVSALPKSNFLILDEGLGALDADNLSSIFMLFDVLRTQFDFLFLISHVDATRDIADNLVEIERLDGYSKIQVK